MLTDKRLSVVIPCYNEEDNIPEMHRLLTEVCARITPDYELIFVNNGSWDTTEALLADLARRDPRVVVLNYTRNFNTDGANSGGMDIATGDAVVLIDGDIQDPPALIEEFVKKWLEGYQVVYGVRKKRKASLILRMCYKAFYRLLRWASYIDIPADAGNFSLMDRRVVDAINAMPERDRFLRGMRAWVGFRHTGIDYARLERFGGETQRPFTENFRAAGIGIFSFSYAPLQLLSYAALAVCGLAFLGALYIIIGYLVVRPGTDTSPRGFATTIVIILLLGGMQLLGLAIVGTYIGHIFEEVKMRPKYLIRDILNNPRAGLPENSAVNDGPASGQPGQHRQQ